MDFSFVRLIDAGGIGADWLQALRQRAVPGSHTDAILKEALLDRDYDRACLSERIRALSERGDYILSSFPDRSYAGANLLVRSEFLVLRDVGAGKFSFRDTSKYVDRTTGRILCGSPRAVMYRCLDYNPDEVDFLPDRYCRQSAGATLKSRGAQRLLDQPFLLDVDCRVIQSLVDADVPVDVLIPFVQFPQQVSQLRTRILDALSTSSRDGIRLGIMVEVPVNIYQIAAFDTVDFFVFGPGDLLKYFYGGIDRNEREFEMVSLTALTEPIRFSLAAIDALGGREVLFAKGLIEWSAGCDRSEYPATVRRALYTPNQIARPLECGLGRAITANEVQHFVP